MRHPDPICVYAHIAMFALLGIGLTGCAVNPKAHFDQVQSVVYARTGQRIQWNRGTREDQQVGNTIRGVLAHELGADQVVQIALLNNAEMQATFEDLGIAQADLVQAGLLKNPVISAEIRFPSRPHYPVEANLEESFLEIIFLPLRKSVAAASFEQAKAQVTDAVIRRAADARTAFFRFQGAQQLAELRRTVLEAAEANLDAARRLREAGNNRVLDYAYAEALAAQARIDVSDADLAAADAREELNGLMGLWGPDAAVWKVAAHLTDPPAADTSPEGSESLALAQRQDLLASRNALLAAARTAGFANYAAMLSGAAVGAHYQRDADVKGTLGPAIVAPIPIFDQGQAAGARAQAQFRQAQDRYDALTVQIRSQVRKAQIHMAAAHQRATYYRDIVLPLRRRIVDETLLQYNGMFIGVSGLLQAKQDEINAVAYYVEALRDYWVARTELELAIGGRLTETAPATQPAPSPTTLPGK